MGTRYTHEEIMRTASEVVFDHWLQHGEGMTIAEVAEMINVSATTLRRHADNHGGCPQQCNMTTVRQASYSKNYVGTCVAERNVDAWEPSGAYIRERIQQLRSLNAWRAETITQLDAAQEKT